MGNSERVQAQKNEASNKQRPDSNKGGSTFILRTILSVFKGKSNMNDGGEWNMREANGKKKTFPDS